MSVCVCACAYVCLEVIEREYASMCVTVCIILFILRCTALVFSKTIQTMCQTGFYYIGALYGSSTIM